jgi:hypothetical protein
MHYPLLRWGQWQGYRRDGSGKIHVVQIQRKPPPQNPNGQIPVTNWPEYDAPMVKCGSLTAWIAQDALAAWQAPATGKRSGEPLYSAIAIETSPALRLVFQRAQDRHDIPDHTT